MGRVQTLATMSEVRLRKWPAGRVSQLKLFLGHLEQVVGISLAAQVEQSPKRKFSEFVPKIVPQDITTEASHKEIRIFFETPRGIKNLLFYEYQISSTEGFYNFEQFNSPESFYIWPQLDEGRTYYLRIRVVTKNGEVGPWSDVIAAETPYSQAYGLYDGVERQTRISANNGYPWVPIYERDYTAIGGKAYYSIDYEVGVARTWAANFAPDQETGNIEWSDCEFRWVENIGSTGLEEDYVQKGQSFFATTYASADAFGTSGFYAFAVGVSGYTTPLESLGAWTISRKGTFVQKFSTLESGDMTIRLEGKVMQRGTAANDFYPIDPARTKFLYESDAIVKVKNFNIFETLVTDS
jgi:hypothetical protein